ncbi:hypothetical protein [Pontiella sulfatireligans]|uniref:hypothetical protein n=1 Tax=Pontiella sulfatireligans TaxID=2750658 RepID=UPI00109D50AA|nr:hypothetical protein [Pontiella sulfatireligans]
MKPIICMGILCAGATQAAELFVGWTRTSWGPPPDISLQVPGRAGFGAVLTEVDNSGYANKWDRGSIDLSFGSQYSGFADEVGLHDSGSAFSIGQSDALQIAITNDTGAGSSMVFHAVMADATAPFSNSPEILQISYKEGGLGLAPGTVLGLWTNSPGSGLTGYDDYADFDADLNSYVVADRTLSNGQHAVFEIAVSGGSGATYIDNIAVDGVYNPAPSTDGTIAVTVDPADQKWTISDKLVGMHCRYDDARDSIYADGSKAAWAATNNIGFMRYPGGSTTKTYDWQNPSGGITADSWDPVYSSSIPVNPPSEWMGLDEYLAFCDAANMIPHVGINWLSGSKFRTLEEGIKRASNCVQYVKDSGYPGAEYYIGNEDMWELCLLDDGVASVTEGAGFFVQYAQAMKAVDPNIRVYWNNNNITSDNLLELLAVAGGWVDGVEFHSKWPYGGDGDMSVWDYDDWKTEFPLIDHRRARTHRDLADTLRAAAADAGYPDLLMANNEYGIGKNQYIEGFNRYTVNLVVIDFLQELFIGNYDRSAFWDNSRQQGASTGEQSLFDPYNGNRFNPSAAGFEMLAPAQGATMLGSSSSHANVYGFAAATDAEYMFYLINKTESDQQIEITFDTAGVDAAVPASGLSLIEAIGQWGTNQSIAVSFNIASNSYTGTLPALSYNRIDFARLNPPTYEEIQSVDSGNWTNEATWSVDDTPDYLDRVLLKFQDVVTVDAAGNQVGNLRLDGGQAYLDIVSGGSLEILNNGVYPTNGAVSFKAAGSALGIRLQGGSLTVGGNFEFGAGGSGITNLFSIEEGTVSFGSYTAIAAAGGGYSLMDMIGSGSSISIGGNLALGPGAILRWTADENSTVSPMQSAAAKNVALNGSLIVDLSAATNQPSEILLIDNVGSGSISGSFASTNIIGSTVYTLSHSGGDGNDLALVYSGSAYDLWAAPYSLVGGQDDDDDNDGLVNLSEYGLGGDPTNGFVDGHLPTFGSSGNVFEYVYPRRTAIDSRLTYYLELTDQLISGIWTNSGYTETGAGDIDGMFEAVTNEVPISGKTNEFIRLIITTE